MRCQRPARRSRARIAAIGVVALLGARSTVARADSSFALSWREMPGACVTEAALRRVVAEKLGRDPFTDRDRADVVIEGEETSRSAPFRARVLERARDGAVLGSREIDAADCARLIRATGIVVALFVKADEERAPGEARAPESPRVTGPAPAKEQEDADRGATSAPSLPPERPPPRDRERPSLSAPPARSPPRERPPPGAARPPFELVLGAGGSAAVGILPSASAAVRAVARLERPSSRWSFEWTAGYTFPQPFRTRAVRGTLLAVDQQARACFDLSPERRVRVDTCAGAFWGAVIPSTAGLTHRNDTWRPLAGPEAVLAAQLREGTRAGRLELGIAAPVVGRTFYFQSVEAEPERLYSTGRVIVFLGVSGLLTIL